MPISRAMVAAVRGWSPGHHDQADPCLLGIPNRRGSFGAHGVAQSHESDQREIVLGRLDLVRKLVQAPQRERQHPHPLGGHVLRLLGEVGPELTLEHHRRSVRCGDVTAPIDDGLGSPLYE